jgi:hypothetical protein
MCRWIERNVFNAVRSGDAYRFKTIDLSACVAPESVMKLRVLFKVRSFDVDRPKSIDLSACEAPDSVRKDKV